MGSTSTQKTESEKSPWGPAIPHLEKIMAGAGDAYGKPPQLWNGPTLANLDPRMAEGMGQVGNIAQQNQPGLMGAYNAAASGAGNPNSITTGGEFNKLYSRNIHQNIGANNVMGNIATGGAPISQGATAASGLGSMLDDSGSTNPHLKAMLDANAERVANRVNSSMSGAGRYGSYAHGDTMARSIGDANNPILAQAYESDQNRRLQAAGLMDSTRNARDATVMNNAGLQLNAASGLAGSQRADTAGAQSALQGMTGVQQQNVANQQGWAGMMPGLAAAQYQGADRLMGMGQYMTDRSQAELNDQRGLYEREQNMPWEQLGKYAGLLYPAASLGGNASSTTTMEQQSNPWQTAAGLGMAGVGLLTGRPGGFGTSGSGMFGSMGQMFGGPRPAAPGMYGPQPQYLW